MNTPSASPTAGATSDTANVELAGELLYAAAREGVSPRILRALSLISPASCLQLLCDPEHAVAEALPTGDLSSAIRAAVEGFDGDAQTLRMYASQLAERYANVMTAEAAVSVLATLGSPLAPTEQAAMERIAARFPTHPEILRAAIKDALAREDRASLDALLTKLGNADGAPGTISFIRRQRQPGPMQGERTARVALVSSYTVDQLVPYVDLACRGVGVVPTFYVAPFNSWTQDVVDETSGLRRFDPEIVFFAVSIDDLAPQLTKALSGDDLDAAGQSALQRVLGVIQAFKTWAPQTPLVVHGFHSVFAGPLGILDDGAANSRMDWLARLNATLKESLRAMSSCYYFDVAGAVAAGDGSLKDNPKLRHLAAMRLPPTSLRSVADGYARFIAPLKGLTKKCLVVDLDNTLWGGVVGEDSKDGIRLGSTSPGSEFVEFQEFLRSLSSRGILLAINSKNNADDALDVLRTHESMVLRESDFSAIRINWKPKHENMISIAEELNIGLDSLVFVDDNPDEREQMRQLLPDVLTVDLPKDPSLYRASLERLPQLQVLSVTDEDRARAEQYRTGRLREQTRVSAGSIDEYLRSIELVARIEPASAASAARIAQLFARTNQFNLTSRRYSLGDVAAFLDDPRRRLYTLTSHDRFGEHGLVAIALVRCDAPNRWEIDSFLMSCRVIGYGIESALLAHLSSRARNSGASELVGEYIETKKNVPARDFYAKHGFSLDDVRGDVHRWRLPEGRHIEFPAWVKVDAQ